ncbi:MAG: MFS transporter [Actinobacteria bacterium]|nr:MFS transporter [Actinomycetota bacterium]
MVPVLVGVTLVVSIISSLGAPLLPAVASALSVSLSSAQWSLTAALLAGAVAAPVLGRLGDGPHRRGAIIVTLLVVTVGGIVAGAAETLPLLIVGRVLQGIGLGLAPIAMAAARDHLPAERAAGVIGLLSVSAAAGVGAGYPISGLVAERFDVHVAFFFGAVLSAGAVVACLLVLPGSRATSTAPLDVPGAALGGLGVVALLIGVGEGAEWGWLSPAVLGCFALAAVVLAAWVRLQLRRQSPLVDLRQLRHRAVLGADLAAVLLGIALYMFLTVVTEFVQTPSRVGFGFDASTLVAGLCLVPFSLVSLAASRLVGPLARRIGTAAVMAIGSLAIAVAGAFFALDHGALWEAFAAMGVLGVGFGFTFAAIPGLIARSVPAGEVGSAMGFYQVVRSIGFSVGSALVASVLAAFETGGAPFPGVGGYTLGLWIAAAICILAALVALVFSPRGRDRPTPEDERRARDDAELASAGLAEG